jgi:hypothetical protein
VPGLWIACGVGDKDVGNRAVADETLLAPDSRIRRWERGLNFSWLGPILDLGKGVKANA